MRTLRREDNESVWYISAQGAVPNNVALKAVAHANYHLQTDTDILDHCSLALLIHLLDGPDERPGCHNVHIEVYKSRFLNDNNCNSQTIFTINVGHQTI